jgi:cell division protein FtsB
MSRSRRWRLVVLAAALFVGFLYYRPLHAYFDTKHALTARRADVDALESQKRSLERRLSVTTSPAALELEARRLGLVKPGERLFIVQGIAAWKRKHGGSIRPGG